MMIVKAVCVLTDGQVEEARAAVRELTERAAAHPGVLAYQWSEDPMTGTFVDHEVHEDEQALIGHIQRSDLARMHACLEIRRVEVHGDAPSPDLEAQLRAFGDYHHFPAA